MIHSVDCLIFEMSIIFSIYSTFLSKIIFFILTLVNKKNHIVSRLSVNTDKIGLLNMKVIYFLCQLKLKKKLFQIYCIFSM